MISDLGRWTVQESSELYDVADWGKGYFSIAENGHLLVHPNKQPDRSIDLKQLVDTLGFRGIDPPILLRSAEILKQRQASTARELAQLSELHLGDKARLFKITSMNLQQ